MIQNPSSKELTKMAKWESRLMYSILAIIAVNIFTKMTVPVMGIMIIPIVIYQMVSVYKLGTTAQCGWVTWLVMVLTIVPLFGLFAMVIMSTRINRLFKERGIPVGFMGPDITKIPTDSALPNTIPSLPPTI